MLTSPLFWLIVAIIASVIAIIYIIVRKFPALSTIDTSDLPDEQQKKIKKDMIAERLSRKLSERMSKVKNIAVPTGRVAKRFATDLYSNIRTMQKEHRLTRNEKISSGPPTRIVERDILREAADHFAAGDLQKAEDAFISVISHNEQNVEAYEGLTEVYFAKKEYDHAEETLQYLLRLKGQNVAEQEKKPGKKVVSEGEREMAVHHFELGEIHEKSGDHNKAIRSYKEALKIDKRNPKYLDRLTEVSILQENKLLAQKTLDALKGVNPDNTKIRDFQRRIDAL